jgi:type IV pilus assembly protein PilC
MAVGVTIFLLTFVLPKFYTGLRGQGGRAALGDQVPDGTSQPFMVEWPFIVGGRGGSGSGLFVASSDRRRRFWIDKPSSPSRSSSGMFRSLYISRSLQTMGELINAGVPMLDTLASPATSRATSSTRACGGASTRARQAGQEDRPRCSRTPCCPSSVVQMIGAGEESGKLGEVLDEISGQFYAKQLKDTIKAVTVDDRADHDHCDGLSRRLHRHGRSSCPSSR